MRILALIWGIGGILLLLGFAVWRLVPNALAAFEFDFTVLQWLLLIGNTLIMMYYEGYKGFQLAFSPRAAARAKYLFEEGTFLQLLAAPFFCMAYFAAPKRRKIATWVLTISIIILVLIFQRLPQPFRGILDVGVVVGLCWGMLATSLSTLRAFTHSDYPHDAEVAN